MAIDICCHDCKNFNRDLIGSGLGIGSCQEFNDYMDKKPNKGQIDKALVKLGNKAGDLMFWGGTLKNRSCEKFIDRDLIV